MRDINEFLKGTILRKRLHRDVLETVDVVRNNNNNNNNNNNDTDDNGENGDYAPRKLQHDEMCRKKLWQTQH